MVYDEHSKIVEEVMLVLYAQDGDKHLTYQELNKLLPEISVIELKRCLTDYAVGGLFHTECECMNGTGKSMDDMYMLSVEGKRFIKKSESGWNKFRGNFHKPVKLYFKSEAKKESRNNRPTVVANIIAGVATIIAIISAIIAFYQWSEAKAANVDRTKVVQLQNDTTNLIQQVDSFKLEARRLKDSILKLNSRVLIQPSKQSLKK